MQLAQSLGPPGDGSAPLLHLFCSDLPRKCQLQLIIMEMNSLCSGRKTWASVRKVRGKKLPLIISANRRDTVLLPKVQVYS